MDEHSLVLAIVRAVEKILRAAHTRLERSTTTHGSLLAHCWGRSPPRSRSYKRVCFHYDYKSGLVCGHNSHYYNLRPARLGIFHGPASFGFHNAGATCLDDYLRRYSHRIDMCHKAAGIRVLQLSREMCSTGL